MGFKVGIGPYKRFLEAVLGKPFVSTTYELSPSSANLPPQHEAVNPSRPGISRKGSPSIFLYYPNSYQRDPPKPSTLCPKAWPLRIPVFSYNKCKLIYIYISTYTALSISLHMRLCPPIHPHIYVYIQICVCVRVQVYIYIYTYMHMSYSLNS